MTTTMTGTDWADEFFNGPAISTEHQDALRELLHTLARTDDRVTLVLGAGVSLDVGLPSWDELINKMVGQISEERWHEPIRADRSDAMRKAEYVIQMVKEGTKKLDEEIVRDALYPTPEEPPPGPLADAVARLAAMLAIRKRVNVLTTNFDTLVERALESYPGSPSSAVSLDEFDSDPVLPNTTAKIIHVHGVAIPKQLPQKPVVLTESSFLREGQRVRTLIAERLLDSTVIFIGVSLTDPNLVGPLWETKGKGSSHATPYVFVVAAPERQASDHNDSKAYAVKRAMLLGEELGVRTIFLKAYSQLSQVLYEASLAMAEPDSYLDDLPATTSLRYGHRLESALDHCYRALGCDDGQDNPSGSAAEVLSEKLHEKLHGPGSVTEYFRAFRKKMPRSTNPRLRDAYAKHASDLETERFGLFLWLRSRGENTDQPDYAIKLLGSSVYIHREPWSLDRIADVTPHSRHASARAVFFGTSQLQNLSDGRDWQLWRSMLAVPLSLQRHRYKAEFGAGKYLDSLPVGAITLNSTNVVERKSDKDKDKFEGPKSLMSYLPFEHMKWVETTIADYGRQVIEELAAQ